MQDGDTLMGCVETKQSRSLFKPASWAAKINFINHLILLNNVLITIIAEKEGGKSSFKTLLQGNLEKQIKSVSMSIQPPCDEGQIIEALTSQLYLNRTSETNIASIVTQVNERKAHVLLILDDAQNLPETLVKDILWAIKSQGDFGFFHVCLVSDYSVVATLNQLADSQLNNLIHTIELGPLSESEMRTYVLQRAMTAQLIHKPLAENQLKKFYRSSKGNIANINKNLESFVLQSSNAKPLSFNPKILKSAGIGMAAIAAVGFSYVYFDGFNNLRHFPHMENSTTPPATEQTILQDTPVNQAAIEFNSEANIASPEASVIVAEKALVSDIPSLLESSNVELVDTATRSLDQQIKVISETLSQSTVEQPTLSEAQVLPEGQVSQEDQMQQEGPQEALAPQADSGIQTDEQSSQSEQALQSERLSQTNTVTDTTNLAAAPPIEAPDKLISAARLSANQTYQDQLIAQKTIAMVKLAQAVPKIAKAKLKAVPKAKSKKVAKTQTSTVLNGGYTIQLTASHNVKDIQKFKKSNKIFAKTQVRHFVNGQGHWYILTYGDYKNKDQAQAHASGLPSQFSKLKPWVRTLSGLNDVG